MLHKSLSDKELVRQVLDGDTDVYARLVERHIHGAHAIAYASAGNVPDAEDAVQESFLRALERLRTLRNPAKFGSWLLTIVRHEASRVRAERARSAKHLDTMNASVEAVAPDAATREFNQRVREQVMRLNEPHREVLLLHYYAGRSTREIAELLGVRQGAVLKRLQRAREQLGESLVSTLTVESMPESEMKQRAGRIASIAIAASAAAGWKSGAASAASGIPLIFKGVAAAVAAAALTAGVMIVALSVPAGRGETAGRPGVTGSAAPSAAPVEASEPEVRLAQAIDAERAPAAQASQTQADPAANAQPGSVAAEPAPATSDNADDSLDGAWMLTIHTQAPAGGGAGSPGGGGASRTVLQDRFEVVLKQTGPSVAVMMPGGSSTALGAGSLAGPFLRLDIASPRLTAFGTPTFSAEGDLRHGSDHINLVGTYVEGDTPFTRNTPDGPVTLYPTTRQVSAALERFPKEELSQRAYVALKLEEVRALHAAVVRFRQDRGAAYPRALSETVPVYLPSFDPYEAPGGARTSYAPPSPDVPSLSAFPWTLSDVIRRDAVYRPELPMPERLAAFEGELGRFWGDHFLTDPYLVVRYDQYGLVVRATLNGDISYTTGDEIAGNAQLATLRAQCANNLKQLGLTIKMFMSEVRGDTVRRGG